MALKRKINETIFTLKIRKALSDLEIEQLKIVKNETIKMIESRQKKK